MIDKLFGQFNIFSHLNFSLNWGSIVEIIIVAGIIYSLYIGCIRHSHAEKLLRGIVFLVCTWLLSEILIMFNLTIIGMFIRTIVVFISLGLIVIFQPELRRFMGYLSQPGYISKAIWGNKSQLNIDKKIDVLKEVIEAVQYLAKTKTGALIVFQNDFSPSAYSDVGTQLNADISTELILTIFHTNTPLHDGAIVIKNNKLLSAGVLLPLTEDPKLSWKYGTRHRAAIGLSEISDCACLVVSEETGDVSVCLDGTLKKYEDITTLKNDLEKILGLNEIKIDKTTKNDINNLISTNKIKDNL